MLMVSIASKYCILHSFPPVIDVAVHHAIINHINYTLKFSITQIMRDMNFAAEHTLTLTESLHILTFIDTYSGTSLFRTPLGLLKVS